MKLNIFQKIIIILIFSSSICNISNGQTGPAGVGTNDGTSSLVLWLDANKSVFNSTTSSTEATNYQRIALWKDLSGKQNDVKAITDTARPTIFYNNPLLNNQNGILFSNFYDTLNQKNYLVSNNFIPTNDVTIYCVFHALTKPGGNNVSPFKAKTYGPNMWYNGAGLVDAGKEGFVNDISLAMCDTSIAAGAGDVSDSTDYCVKYPASINKSYFATLQKEAWSGKLSISNNANIDSVYQAGKQPINNGRQYFIGSNSNVKYNKINQFLNGYIANILIYNKILTSAEKIILENYLSARYNIAISYNDLYSFDNKENGDYDFELIGLGKANDGSSQLTAKGEGVLEIGNVKDLNKGNFIFIAHDGKTLTPTDNDIAKELAFRQERTWVFSSTSTSQTLDLNIDAKELQSNDYPNIVLLIDKNKNGSFSDEILGDGIINSSTITSKNQIYFRDVKFNNGDKFTFANLKPICKTNCDTYFSPDNDGLNDFYFLPKPGKTNIYNRAGKLVKSITTPAYWDGSSDNGEVLNPGIYILISSENTQETITLIR